MLKLFCDAARYYSRFDKEFMRFDEIKQIVDLRLRIHELAKMMEQALANGAALSNSRANRDAIESAREILDLPRAAWMTVNRTTVDLEATQLRLQLDKFEEEIGRELDAEISKPWASSYGATSSAEELSAAVGHLTHLVEGAGLFAGRFEERALQ